MTVFQTYPAAHAVVKTGGQAVVAFYGPMAGGTIVNPRTETDQGLLTVEPIFVDLVADAGLAASTTTVPVQPGGWFTVPENFSGNVSVNAQTSGHRFSAVMWRAPAPYPPTPTNGPFPPAGPTSIQKIIPSYLYREYADDDDLRAFVARWNVLAQSYVDWFNNVPLALYIGDLMTGLLLDWTARGIYGIDRPALSSGQNRNVGPLNTWALNTIPLNTIKIIGPTNAVVTTDDVYKRVMTWALFKGDGKIFNVRWLKRRIMRFLLGANGTSFNVDQTYQVSVSFGGSGEVSIRLITGIRTITGGAVANMFACNTVACNTITSTFISVSPLPNAVLLQEAIDSGVLELPFQFTYVVTV